MQSLTTERARTFRERHQAIDLVRAQRESGGSLAPDPGAVRALLQELDLLQVVAQAAEHVAGYPVGASAEELLASLQYSLRRWKE
jgi:hypothetical protein